MIIGIVVTDTVMIIVKQCYGDAVPKDTLRWAFHESPSGSNLLRCYAYVSSPHCSSDISAGQSAVSPHTESNGMARHAPFR